MTRYRLLLLRTLPLAVLLAAVPAATAQHHGGGHPGGHPGGPGFHTTNVYNLEIRRSGYPWWGYGPPFVGIDIGLGYGYGYGYPYLYAPPYPAYAPVVAVPAAPPPPPPVAAPPPAPPAAPPPATLPPGLSDPLPPPRPADNLAHIHVVLPAEAQLWVDGVLTTQTGAERDFTTPALTPGKTYTYDLKARWERDGRPFEQTLVVEVRAERTTTVNFNPVRN